MPDAGNPLHGNHSIPAVPPVPPVPPVPALPIVPPVPADPELMQGPVARHAADERLVDPTGAPLDLGVPTAGPSAPVLAKQIKAVDNRHRRNAALLAAGIAAVLAFALLVAWLVHNQRAKVDSLDSRTLHNDVQTTQAQADQRVFLCRQATFLLGLDTTDMRANWPKGGRDYDVTLAAVRQSAVDASCPGI